MFHTELLSCVNWLGILLLLVNHLCAEDIQQDRLTPILDYMHEIAIAHSLNPGSPIPIIAVGGCPGVGKTYFSELLANSLEARGDSCFILHQDHFNLSPEARRLIPCDRNIDHLKSDKLHMFFEALVKGQKQIEKPVCNQLTGEMGLETVDLREVNLVLFDGHYSLCTHAPVNFFDYCLFGIFLETEDVNAYAWKKERELKKTVQRTPEQFARHMEILLKEYHENSAYSKTHALFVVIKDAEHGFELQMKDASIPDQRR